MVNIKNNEKEEVERLTEKICHAWEPTERYPDRVISVHGKPYRINDAAIFREMAARTAAKVLEYRREAEKKQIKDIPLYIEKKIEKDTDKEIAAHPKCFTEIKLEDIPDDDGRIIDHIKNNEDLEIFKNRYLKNIINSKTDSERIIIEKNYQEKIDEYYLTMMGNIMENESNKAHAEPKKEVTMILSPETAEFFENYVKDSTMDYDGALYHLLREHAIHNMEIFIKEYENYPSKEEEVNRAKETLKLQKMLHILTIQKIREKKEGKPEGHIYTIVDEENKRIDTIFTQNTGAE